MVSCRANANPLDLHSDKLLNVLDVVPRLDGQVVVARYTSCRLFPARQRVVLYFNLAKYLGVRREAFEHFTVVRVGCRNFEFVKIVEDVELGEVDGGVVVAGVRVLDDNKVEPAAAALATGCDANFVAYRLELLAQLVQLLSREGSTVVR